jgi:hypothetical protein
VNKAKLLGILAKYSPPLTPSQVELASDEILADLKKEAKAKRRAKATSKSRK